MAHDWGGPISLGWAQRHHDRIAGLMLANTAVHRDPADASAAGLIRLARQRLLRELVCVRTATFVRAAAALSRPPLPRRGTRRAPGTVLVDSSAAQAVGEFVADIPLRAEPSQPRGARSRRDGLAGLAASRRCCSGDPRDPSSPSDSFATWNTGCRMPTSTGTPGASHLVTEDVPQAAEDAWSWVRRRIGGCPQPTPARAAAAALRWCCDAAARLLPSHRGAEAAAVPA